MANKRTLLKKIVSRAKALRKEHPRMSWLAAQKQAGKEYRTAPVRKVVKAVKKKTVVAKKAHTVKKKSVGSISGVRSTLIKALSSEYAQLASNLVRETTKRGAAAIKKKMREIISEMRRLNNANKG